MTTLHEVALLRLVAQGIAAPAAATAGEVVRRMTALQGQDLPGALTSVALRTAGGSRADVTAALATGEVVRSWPMRGTLHLVPGEDLGWMLELTGQRMVARSAARRAGLGLHQADLDRGRQVTLDVLDGGRQLSRAELLAAWQDAGLDTSGQRGPHLLGYLAQTGCLCLGPLREGEQLVVLLAQWVPQPRRPQREEALREWALRFFRSHGPATLQDFVRWTQLTTADARAGLAAARGDLSQVEVDGVEHHLDPATPARLAACRSEARDVFLLPGFDEYLLGYADRSAVLPAAYAERIVPGGNGMFLPTVVADGQVVGTWRRRPRRRSDPLATPFTTFSEEVASAVARLREALP